MTPLEKSKGFFGEFKKFALRGNVIDLAVGVIIGGAFGTITTSLVQDIIMPFAGLFLGKASFSSFSISLGPLLPGTEPAVLKLGTFIQTVINFLILALVVFLIVKFINRLRELGKKEEAAQEAQAPKLSTQEQLLTEIRDLLQKNTEHDRS